MTGDTMGCFRPFARVICSVALPGEAPRLVEAIARYGRTQRGILGISMADAPLALTCVGEHAEPEALTDGIVLASATDELAPIAAIGPPSADLGTGHDGPRMRPEPFLMAVDRSTPDVSRWGTIWVFGWWAPGRWLIPNHG